MGHKKKNGMFDVEEELSPDSSDDDDSKSFDSEARKDAEEKEKLMAELNAKEDVEQKEKAKKSKLLKKIKGMEEKLLHGSEAME